MIQPKERFSLQALGGSYSKPKQQGPNQTVQKFQIKMTSRRRWPKNIKCKIYQQQPVRSFSNFKLNLTKPKCTDVSVEDDLHRKITTKYKKSDMHNTCPSQPQLNSYSEPYNQSEKQSKHYIEENVDKLSQF